jgi:hypothetical protein
MTREVVTVGPDTSAEYAAELLVGSAIPVQVDQRPDPAPFDAVVVGDPPFPPDEPRDVAALTYLTGARGHVTFPGRLDKERLSFGERAMATATGAPTVDFGDWDAARRWGGAIPGVGQPTPVGT